MKNCDESPNMSDFYKVLKYLPKARVDRQEPCVFNSIFVDGEVEKDTDVFEVFEIDGTFYMLDI